MKNFHKKGFTLVELIVVITILAILGTIAFISLQGYSKSARDSKRVSDIGNIKTSLALFNTRTGRYPEPDQITNIVYSGTTVWTQGIIGEDTTRQLRELGKIPLDPLLQEEYTYSLLSTKDEYEIGSIMENEQMGFIKKTFAEEQKYYTLITGNYNGKVAKAYSGNDIYVFGIPSIIGSDLSSNDLIEIINKKALSFNGYQNIPDNFKGNNIAMTGSFDFGGENFDILIYSGNKDLLSSSGTILENFGNKLKEIYGGSILANHNDYKEIKNLDTSNSNELNNVIGTIINNNLGGKIIINHNNGNNNIEIITSCSLNEAELTNLNTFFEDTDYNGDEEYWCNLTELNIYEAGLSGTIPSEIKKLLSLEYIDLGNNNLNINNLNFYNLTNLTSLYLNEINLTSIPSTIYNLSNLEYLSLNNNQISKIPDFLANFNNLQGLYLSGNDSLGYLNNDFESNSEGKTQNNITTNGYALNIKGNGNKILFTKYSNLTESEVNELNTYFSSTSYNGDNNYWSNINEIIANNIGLTGELPEVIGKLYNLHILSLSDNLITKLPNSIGNLVALTNLDLYGNKLNNLPETFTNLTNIENLKLYENLLGDINDNYLNTYTGINTEKNITLAGKSMTIQMNGSKIIISTQNGTTCIISTSEVETLNTYFSGLGYTGNESYWCNLNEINLNNQTLPGNIPEEIGLLTNLNTLILSNTNLTQIPDSLSNLLNLTRLDLSGNTAFTNINYNFLYNEIEYKVEYNITPSLHNIVIEPNGRFIRIHNITPH